MEASGEPVDSMATESPGVLVSAPQRMPARISAGSPKAYFSTTEVTSDTITSRKASTTYFRPLDLKESKNPGPACKPTVNMNSTSPMVCSTGDTTIP